MLCLKLVGWVANSVNADETSHLGLHCLLRLVCPNTYGKYSIYRFDWIDHAVFR